MLLNIKHTKNMITKVIELTKYENQLANVMIWGEAGNGKSQIVKQIGEEMGIKVFDKRLSLMNEDNILVRMPNHKTRMLESYYDPDFLEIAERCKAGKKTILFLDEFQHGKREVMNIMFRILAERELDDFIKFNHNLIVVAASNLDYEDPDLEEMPHPLISRFFFLVNLDVSPNVTIEYFHKKQYYDIAGFLTLFKSETVQHTGELPERIQMKHNLNPRNWEQIQLYYAAGIKKMRVGDDGLDMRRIMLSSMSSDSTASVLVGILDKALDIDIEAIVALKEDLPSDIEVLVTIYGEIILSLREKDDKVKKEFIKKLWFDIKDKQSAEANEILSLISSDDDIINAATELIHELKDPDYRKLITVLL